jgi:RNA ligase
MRPPQRYIDDGLISCRAHPDDPELVIFNYTKRCQFDQAWDEHTLRCRGLIMRGDVVLARPFPKFFNLEELAEPPRGKPVAVYEKLDGSLGILYPHPDGSWAIATRGSFDSPQAFEATEMLRDDPEQLLGALPERTYLFEIIYPENRVVVDYFGDSGLFLLAVRDTETGNEIPHGAWLHNCRHAVRYSCDDWTELRDTVPYPAEGGEGFVVLFDTGQRVKLKYAEYVRLHRAISGLTPRRVWEIMVDPKLDVWEYVAGLPDEFMAQAETMVGVLQDAYTEVEMVALDEYMPGFSLRKDAAEYFKTCTYPAIMFKMLDGRPYGELIWKAIKP